MQRALRHGLVTLTCAVAQPALAQDDFQQWLTLSARTDATDMLVIQNELVTRFSDDRDGLYELENTLLLGYKLNKSVTAWAGYVHNPQYGAGDFTVMERRAREQITLDDFAKLGAVSLSGRMRLEQRWRNGTGGTAWRVRPYVKAAVPLGGSRTPTFNVTAEAFFNLNNTPFQTVDGIDRLRSAASLTFPLTKGVKIEAGYLNQHRFVRGGPDSDDHALTASIALSF